MRCLSVHIKSLKKSLLKKNHSPPARVVKIDVMLSLCDNKNQVQEEMHQHHDHISQTTLQFLFTQRKTGFISRCIQSPQSRRRRRPSFQVPPRPTPRPKILTTPSPPPPVINQLNNRCNSRFRHQPIKYQRTDGRYVQQRSHLPHKYLTNITELVMAPG